jgi:hypothetical protein
VISNLACGCACGSRTKKADPVTRKLPKGASQQPADGTKLGPTHLSFTNPRSGCFRVSHWLYSVLNHFFCTLIWHQFLGSYPMAISHVPHGKNKLSSTVTWRSESCRSIRSTRYNFPFLLKLICFYCIKSTCDYGKFGGSRSYYETNPITSIRLKSGDPAIPKMWNKERFNREFSQFICISYTLDHKRCKRIG